MLTLSNFVTVGPIRVVVYVLSLFDDIFHYFPSGRVGGEPSEVKRGRGDRGAGEICWWLRCCFFSLALCRVKSLFTELRVRTLCAILVFLTVIFKDKL